jgi:hypothetical protein
MIAPSGVLGNGTSRTPCAAGTRTPPVDCTDARKRVALRSSEAHLCRRCSCTMRSTRGCRETENARMSDDASPRPASHTLGDLVDEMATATPGAEALVFRDERLDSPHR